jgi:uncharacterized protein (TIGR02145 family)
MKHGLLIIAVLVFLTFKNKAQTTVTDIDGNVYNTLNIGTQVWMTGNLKTTKYNNGSNIPLVTDNLGWAMLNTPGFCWYNNDSTSYSNPYGALYNWYTVNTGNICPNGWHMPNDTEWTTLFNYLGGSNVAGGKLKEIGTLHWNSPNTGATNISGFTALPGAMRGGIGVGTFLDTIGLYGAWWSSTEDGYHGSAKTVTYDANYVGQPNDYSKSIGCSVRCVMGNTANQIQQINDNFNIKIYPNHATDRITIAYAEKNIVKMRMYNMLGACVLQGVLANETNEIDVSSLSKGIYIIRLTGDKWIVQRKFTKE